MVGIVIIAHSAKLAEGIKELAEQMSQGRVPIAAAGGLDNNTIGTNAERIFEAINAVYQPDGVLILLDLGSAVLSTEIAIQMLDLEKQSKVLMSEAPILEGAIAATVEASIGSSLKKVDNAARKVITVPKVAGAIPLVQSEAPIDTQKKVPYKNEIILPIINEIGLHARPAALFVQTASKFKSDIKVRNLTTGSSVINAKSMFGVLGLGAQKDHQIAISADGPDVAKAFKTLRKLVESGFGEMDQPPPVLIRTPGVEETQGEMEVRQHVPVADWTMQKLKGIQASPGIAIGPVYLHHPQILRVEQRSVDNSQSEWVRFLEAVDRAKAEIAIIKNRTITEGGAAEAEIFTAHQLFLEDPDLLNQVQKQIKDRHLRAETALTETVESYTELLRNMEGEIFRQRAIDVEDVGQRVLRILLGENEMPLAELSEPVVLVAHDLTPSDTAQLDKEKILGFCTAIGGTTSHTAILAQILRIPAVVGLGEEILNIPEGVLLIIDGEEGAVIINPDDATTATYKSRLEKLITQHQVAKLTAQKPACTQDGYCVEVVANVSDMNSAQVALEYGAEGIGLLRTEFLYLNRDTMPSEEEQYKAYRAIADLMGQRLLIIRTLDIGGDKPLPYLDFSQEINPFLGWRAIRLSLDNIDLFKSQIKAILRAGYERNVKIMFPMITNVEEVHQVKRILAEAMIELEKNNVSFVRDVEVGIMVETPAAALTTDILVKEVDFFSIGTNDLIQYTMACDRTNERMAYLYNPFHPVILRLVKRVIEVAHHAGKWVSMCGKMASDPKAIPILLGLGLDEFSITATAIPETKAVIRSLSLTQAQKIATQALRLKTAKEVQTYVREIFSPDRKMKTR